MERTIISKEDLLVRISKLRAENSLLRSQLVECGKDKALISELEFKVKEATDDRVIELSSQVAKLTKRVEEQRMHLRRLNGNLT